MDSFVLFHNENRVIEYGRVVERHDDGSASVAVGIRAPRSVELDRIVATADTVAKLAWVYREHCATCDVCDRSFQEEAWKQHGAAVAMARELAADD